MHERCGTVICEFCRGFFSITCRGRFSGRNTAWFFCVLKVHTHNLRFFETVVQCGQCRRTIGRAGGSYNQNCMLFNVIINNGYEREEFRLRDALGKRLVRRSDNTVIVVEFDRAGYVVVDQ